MNNDEKIRNAGVVGCGGAGFPSHVKASSKAEVVLGNGAECEPLLHKDLELITREPDAVVHGMQLLMSSTGAKKGILGIKKKYEEKLAVVKSAINNKEIELKLLGDYYPTGDEYILVYEATKKLIHRKGSLSTSASL